MRTDKGNVKRELEFFQPLFLSNLTLFLKPKKRNSQAWSLKKYLGRLRYQPFEICCATWYNPGWNRSRASSAHSALMNVTGPGWVRSCRGSSLLDDKLHNAELAAIPGYLFCTLFTIIHSVQILFTICTLLKLHTIRHFA